MVQQFSEVLHDGETETEPTALRGIRGLLVFLKYPRNIVLGDADAGVPDFDAQSRVPT